MLLPNLNEFKNVFLIMSNVFNDNIDFEKYNTGNELCIFIRILYVNY